MANKIILKKSNQPGKIPTQNVLEYGEVAINLSDKRLYSKDTANSLKIIEGNLKDDE